jgi:hypothetical protein
MSEGWTGQVSGKTDVSTQTNIVPLNSFINTCETRTIAVSKAVFTLSDAPQVVRGVCLKTLAGFGPLTKILRMFVASCLKTCLEVRTNNVSRNVPHKNITGLIGK